MNATANLLSRTTQTPGQCGGCPCIREMKIWVDTQLPPTLANWLSSTFGLEVSALRELSLRDTQDVEVFEAAQDENAVMMTKDSDCIATEPRTLKSRIRLRLLPGASAT